MINAHEVLKDTIISSLTDGSSFKKKNGSRIIKNDWVVGVYISLNIKGTLPCETLLKMSIPNQLWNLGILLMIH